MKKVLFCLSLCVLMFYSCDTSLDDMIVEYNGGEVQNTSSEQNKPGTSGSDSEQNKTETGGNDEQNKPGTTGGDDKQESDKKPSSTRQVASLAELKTAIADAKTSVIKLTGNITVNSTDDIQINRSLTIDGDRYKIKGASLRVTNADADITIQNVYFDGVAVPVSGDDNKSIFYATANHKGDITIKGCTFDNTHWDAIQIVPDTGANIVIDGNEFKESGSVSSLSSNKLRHIHIEADCNKGGTGKGVKRTGLKVAITNNEFRNCKKMREAIIDVDYIDDTCLAASGNTFDESGLSTNNNTGVRISIWPDAKTPWKCSTAYTFFTKS